MAPIDLPYLMAARAKGRTFWYYRRHGKLTRIKGTPGDPEFLEAYHRIHAIHERPAAPGVKEGSLEALIRAYRASEEWQQLAPATRKDYNKALAPLELKWGDKSVATMPREFVLKLRDHYARKPILDQDGHPVIGPEGKPLTRPTPRRANRMVAVLRLLIAWGVDRGWRKDNPALRPRLLRTGPGYRAWTVEQVHAFLACDAVPEPLKRAALLGVATGQRKQDCLAMTKAARRDGGIEVVPEKTRNSSGVRLWIPEHPDLTAALDAAPKTDATTLLTRADGKPWKEDHFNHAFADAVAVAGLAGLSFHGLRKTASAWLAEAGCTDAEIDSIIGHVDPRMTRHYRQQADQKLRATAAMGKLVKLRRLRPTGTKPEGECKTAGAESAKPPRKGGGNAS